MKTPLVIGGKMPAALLPDGHPDKPERKVRRGFQRLAGDIECTEQEAREMLRRYGLSFRQ